VSFSRTKFSALSKVGEGVTLLILDVGVSDLRGGGVGGVAGLCSGVGDAVTLRGEAVLRVDSMVIKVGEGERILNDGDGGLGSVGFN